MKFLVLGLLAVSISVLSPDRSDARCGDNIGDDAAVAATRAEVETACPCGSFTTKRAYVACARGVADMAVAADTLPAQCKQEVLRCARKSTCGRPAGAVTCCRTNAQGVTRCSIRKNAANCKPPRNGSACIGMMSSCCGACNAFGCVVPTPTPTPAVTPTPTAPPATPTAPPATPTPTPPYGSASKAFIAPASGLLQ
jgi:hypothetical protein